MKLKKPFLIAAAFLGALLLIILATIFRAPSPKAPLRLAIAPYQDLAMIVNAEPIGAAKNHGIDLDLVTLSWENIFPAVASAGPTVDVGFGSLVEYLTKYYKVNSNSSDPLLFVQPLYVYKGGGFVALNPGVEALTKSSIGNSDSVHNFMKLRIGAQHQSLYQMVIYSVARRHQISPNTLKITDISMDNGILALQSNSLDVTSAGLPQITKAKRLGGKVVLSMDDAGFADIVGFICKKSTLESRRPEVEGLVRAWFDSVKYVFSDLPNNSKDSLAYIKKNSSSNYSYVEYKAALDQEFLPSSLKELRHGLLSVDAKFPYSRIATDINSYLLENKVIDKPAPIPSPLIVQ
jgi:ABC-type nitrate/sulfonate/bicarbonate transport system substrate-binding protein